MVATELNTPSSSLVTYYFRRAFTVSKSGCYLNLILGILASDGYAVYLNNVEALRVNLPGGALANNSKVYFSPFNSLIHL